MTTKSRPVWRSILFYVGPGLCLGVVWLAAVQPRLIHYIQPEPAKAEPALEAAPANVSPVGAASSPYEMLLDQWCLVNVWCQKQQFNTEVAIYNSAAPPPHRGKSGHQRP